MKVVLFCGGLGTRLRDHSGELPKPMVNIGYRPILWHVMKYYAHYGHKDFILCLGYRADAIKEFFLNYIKDIIVYFINILDLSSHIYLHFWLEFVGQLSCDLKQFEE
jgi:NDP-sugar pyrophosphorylase family protein